MEKIDINFPNDKNTVLFVTGGCGFIGSNFINLILNSYDKICVVNIDAMYYCASEDNISEKWRNSDRYTLVKGNLCSIDLVNHLFSYSCMCCKTIITIVNLTDNKVCNFFSFCFKRSLWICKV